ncbi:MAG: glycosyltransferase family 2 protein [Leucobacter sp.]
MNAQASMPTETVAAVIVTFNRVDKLPNTIASVMAQDHPCEKIVIVDNASSDGTREYLDSLDDPRLVIRHLRENRGGAGGFEYGMALGCELGVDHVWIMDDDCYPAPDALRRLVEERREVAEALDEPVPFACSLVKAIDGALCEMNNPITTWDWPRAFLAGRNAMRIVECTFVSVLVPCAVIAEAGLPLAEYFIWYDDKEYTKRLTAQYAPGIIVMDSIVVHDMGVNAGVNYRQVEKSTLWKFASGARNQASYRWNYEGKHSYLDYERRVIEQMREAGVPREVQAAMRDALLGGKTFNPRPKRPAEMRAQLMLDAGRTATAPPADVVPAPAVPFGGVAEGPASRLRVPARVKRVFSVLASFRRKSASRQQLQWLSRRTRLLEQELAELQEQRDRVDALIDEVSSRIRES